MITKSKVNCVSVLGILLAILATGGCSNQPAALPTPSYDPSGSAAKAMEMYDADGDGFVAGEELENAPGLKAALKNLDKDGDGKVSESEVAERVKKWERVTTSAISFEAIVVLDGKPLDDAKVTLVPEDFMGGVVQAGEGTTVLGGRFKPSIPKDKRPTPTFRPGMQLGIYKVQISKEVDGVETIPAKYNSETVLGQEVSIDDPGIENKRVVYKLNSK